MGLGASRCPTLKDPSWQTRLSGSSSRVKRGGQASQTVGVLLTHQPWARGYPAQGVIRVPRPLPGLCGQGEPYQLATPAQAPEDRVAATCKLGTRPPPAA